MTYEHNYSDCIKSVVSVTLFLHGHTCVHSRVLVHVIS